MWYGGNFPPEICVTNHIPLNPFAFKSHPNLIPSLPNLPSTFPLFLDTLSLCCFIIHHSSLSPVTLSFHHHYSSPSVSVITVLRYFGSLPPLLSSEHHSRLCGWMINIQHLYILVENNYFIVLYASTRVRFYIVLRHSRHLSITIVSSSYLLLVIVYRCLFVFHPSSFSLLRIYSTPIMFQASFLGFVAGLSYCNIFTFLWLNNKFIVFVILWLNYLVVLRYFTWSTFFTI